MPEGERKPPVIGVHEPSGFTRKLQPRHLELVLTARLILGKPFRIGLDILHQGRIVFRFYFQILS